jgi:hypothetical protein
MVSESEDLHLLWLVLIYTGLTGDAIQSAGYHPISSFPTLHDSVLTQGRTVLAGCQSN